MLILMDSSISETELLQLCGDQNDDDDKPQALFLISPCHFCVPFCSVNFAFQPHHFKLFIFCLSLWEFPK